MNIPQKTVLKISEMINEIVNFGYNRGIYSNKISVEELSNNIIETCFKGFIYNSSTKSKFLSVQYPAYYRRKSSSGLFAKSSIIQFTFKEGVLTISFPVHLLNRIVVTLSVDPNKDTCSFITHYNTEQFINEVQKEILKSCILSLKKYKIPFDKNSTSEDIDERMKLVQLMSY